MHPRTWGVLPLALLLLSSARTDAHADAVDRAIESDFHQCGYTVRISRQLNLAALDGFKGFSLQQVLQKQRYRAYRYRGASFTYHGDIKVLARLMENHCAARTGFTEYGLVTNGVTAMIIFATPAQVDLSKSQRWMQEFLYYTNQARFQAQKCNGKLMNPAPPLKWDDRLAAAGRLHASDMVRLNFRGHVNPEDGSRAVDRAARFGFQGVVGENIAYGSLTAQEAVQSLLRSEEHCKNLMDHVGSRLVGQ